MLFNIVASGATYSGDTSAPSDLPEYAVSYQFKLSGFLAVATTIAADNAGQSDANHADLFLSVGDLFGSAAGALRWASNSRLHMAYVENSPATPAIDETNQSFHQATRTLTVDLESDFAMQTLFDSFLWSDDSASPKDISGGQLVLSFAPDFQSFQGSATFIGGLGSTAGSWAWSAALSGSVAGGAPVSVSLDAAFAARPQAATGPAPQDLSPIRDFDGNDLGAGSDWRLIGAADVQNDGDVEYVFVNPTLGRWASVGPDASGAVDFSFHGSGGDTRVVGIYIDPTLAGEPEKIGGPFDSQARFQEDLRSNTLEGVAAFDFDQDGFQEIYFRETDGDAYLRALMHADGNIQYANYQSAEQVEAYLSGLGYGDGVIDSILG